MAQQLSQRSLNCHVEFPVVHRVSSRLHTRVKTSKLTATPALNASSKRKGLTVRCMQSGRAGQPPVDRSTSLVRRPAIGYGRDAVVINMSQVVGKQVIAMDSGKNLGQVTEMRVDYQRWEVANLDLKKKEGVLSNSYAATIPLSALQQIGDVILVQDQNVASYPNYSYARGASLTGLPIRTEQGEVLGKVRDFAFRPDDGALVRIVYDEFGLPFLPINFFDCYAIDMSAVRYMNATTVVVAASARDQQRREHVGIMAAIPALLRSLGKDVSVDAYTDNQALPQGYDYSKWQQDVYDWEQRTGLRYDDWQRQQQQPVQQQAQQQQQQRMRQQQPQARRALPPPSQAQQVWYPSPAQQARNPYQQQAPSPAARYPTYSQYPQTPSPDPYPAPDPQRQAAQPQPRDQMPQPEPSGRRVDEWLVRDSRQERLEEEMMMERSGPARPQQQPQGPAGGSPLPPAQSSGRSPAGGPAPENGAMKGQPSLPQQQQGGNGGGWPQQYSQRDLNQQPGRPATGPSRQVGMEPGMPDRQWTQQGGR